MCCRAPISCSPAVFSTGEHKNCADRPRFEQRSVHREVLVTQQRRSPRLLQHRRQKLLRHFARNQSLPVLG